MSKRGREDDNSKQGKPKHQKTDNKPTLLTLTKLPSDIFSILPLTIDDAITLGKAFTREDDDTKKAIAESVLQFHADETDLEGLYQANLTDEKLLTLLRKYPKLQVIHINECDNISGNPFENLTEELPNLQDINLGDDKITDDGLARIFLQCPNLKRVDLYNCTTLGTNPFQNFVANNNLKYLGLAATNINDNGLEQALIKFSRLKALDLHACNISGETLNDDSLTLDHLEELDLNSSEVTDLGLGRILSKTSKLIELNLMDCLNINGESFRTLENQLFNDLQILYLNGTNITSDNLEIFLLKCPNLIKLDIDACRNLNRDIFQNPKIRLDHLEDIALGSTGIGNNGLKDILVKSLNLKILNLSGCENIDDEIFKDSQLKLNNLERLSLSGTNVTNEVLETILLRCPNLKELDLDRCNKVDDNLRKNLKGKELEALRKIIINKIEEDNFISGVFNDDIFRDVPTTNSSLTPSNAPSNNLASKTNNNYGKER